MNAPSSPPSCTAARYLRGLGYDAASLAGEIGAWQGDGGTVGR